MDESLNLNSFNIEGESIATKAMKGMFNMQIMKKENNQSEKG